MTGPVHVSDHAVLRYLERVVGLDIARLRAEMADACRNSAGAPCVRVEGVRYIVRGSSVVTVLDGKAVPHWEFLAVACRVNARLDEGAR